MMVMMVVVVAAVGAQRAAPLQNAAPHNPPLQNAPLHQAMGP